MVPMLRARLPTMSLTNSKSSGSAVLKMIRPGRRFDDLVGGTVWPRC